MFLQIHTLTPYPPSLLNRDDAGLAKRVPFGNATRLRISSQCLKRHWRLALQRELADVPDGLRTRHFFDRVVLAAVVESGVPEEKAKSLVEELAKALIKGGVTGTKMTQPVLFGMKEADYLVHLAKQAYEENTEDPASALKEILANREQQKNLQAMSKSAAGLTAALFGRMVTSDILARVDAPVHVAHAISVHAARTEMDYFTVVDDLAKEEETGAAHANQTELGAGIYYGYVVLDVPLLVSNLVGCRPEHWRQADKELPQKTMRALIRAIAEQTPGAKLGSTAPYSRAETVLLETGSQQPRQLVNAFLEALPFKEHLLKEATRRLVSHLEKLDEMYGPTAEHRFFATLYELDPKYSVMNLEKAIDAALASIWS